MENTALDSKEIYCLWVRTGQEEKYIEEMHSLIDSGEVPLNGKFYFLKKQMKLKNGKEYTVPIFPGYVFWETEDSSKKRLLREGSGFIQILPKDTGGTPLCKSDLEIITSILKYGTTISVVHVQFDVNDKIQLLDGPFKDMSGKVVAVNRRNKRVNLEVEFLNGMRLIGLTYEEVKKMM